MLYQTRVQIQFMFLIIMYPICYRNRFSYTCSIVFLLLLVYTVKTANTVKTLKDAESYPIHYFFSRIWPFIESFFLLHFKKQSICDIYCIHIGSGSVGEERSRSRSGANSNKKKLSPPRWTPLWMILPPGALVTYQQFCLYIPVLNIS